MLGLFDNNIDDLQVKNKNNPSKKPSNRNKTKTSLLGRTSLSIDMEVSVSNNNLKKNKESSFLESLGEVENSTNDVKSISISEYNSLINSLLSEVLLNIKGEVSELNIWQGKYTYITLKDCDVDTVTTSVFGIVAKIPNIQEIKVGDQIIVTGYPGIHNKTGRHSFQAEKITKVDEGYYEKRRVELIKNLTDEGIIDPSKKRSIKRRTNNIALITAIPSQAYNDFTKIYDSRWGYGQIDVYKAQMQGVSSYKSVIKALNAINDSDKEYDCVIIARGGGSKEDLINFDSEELVRKVFSSKYPTVSAVGHEGDVSICDLVADLRASTPSNAAELITTPDKSYYFQRCEQLSKNIYERIILNIDDLKDEIQERFLDNALLIKRNIESLEKEILSKSKLFDVYDLRNTLKRGFSIITDENDQPISNHNDIKDDLSYNIYLKEAQKEKYFIKRKK